MSPDQVIKDTDKKFRQAVERFNESLKSLRTGRASASMLDGVMVEVYGTQMPLIQTATISTPEAQLIQISPFDVNNIEAISKAIRDNPSLGLNPSDDGRIVRIPIPPLNEERRRELAKQVSKRQEDSMIVLRNIRHEAMSTFEQAKKDKDIGEDDAKRYGVQVEELMNKSRSEVESISKAKEAEIMTV